jgi:alkylation response protein AidB-like acyl-CoA dehydrogenase
MAPLPKLASGEVRGGHALTEPDAGTDLQGIRMTARREGDHYVINGTKTWISNGIEGSCFALLVKTDPDARPLPLGPARSSSKTPTTCSGSAPAILLPTATSSSEGSHGGRARR